jgi:hypothetical protein
MWALKEVNKARIQTVPHLMMIGIGSGQLYLRLLQ